MANVARRKRQQGDMAGWPQAETTLPAETGDAVQGLVCACWQLLRLTFSAISSRYAPSWRPRAGYKHSAFGQGSGDMAG